MVVQPDHLRGSSIMPTLTRRGFVKLGGALMVSFAFPELSPGAAEQQPATSHLTSWLEIRHDNTILVRTGRTEIGTGMSAYYAQVIAEELSVQPESITLLMGDTARARARIQTCTRWESLLPWARRPRQKSLPVPTRSRSASSRRYMRH